MVLPFLFSFQRSSDEKSEGFQSLQQSLSGLPQWASERILQQINQLTHYEPVIGIMGKTGSGKSSLCNALFAGEISPISDVIACTRDPLRFRLQVGKRFMTLVDLPGVGESERRDTEYAALYREQLPGSIWCYGSLRPMIGRWQWMSIIIGR